MLRRLRQTPTPQPPEPDKPEPTTYADAPLRLAADLWPDVAFYDRQIEVIESVWADDECFVVAAHQMGKDFVAGFVALAYFLTAPGPCRVVTTSVKDDHLRVLWGEIGRFVQTAARPLLAKDGGPLVVNHRDVRRLLPGGEVCPISYLRGMVSEKGEGMAGHHAPYTLLVVDEASGAEDVVYDRADTWAKRKLIFGNAYECQNFFRRAVKGGDLPCATTGA